MILIIDMIERRNSLHFEEFVRPVFDIVAEKYDIIHFSELNNKIIEKFDKIILCGTALKDNEYLNHIEKFEWLKKIEKPVLGICAGAQVIAKVFGSEIIEGEEIGFFKLEINKKDKILENVDMHEIYCLHTKSLVCPKGFEIIAKTKYPQIIKKDNIYGVLFHPEVRNKKLIHNFVKL